MNDIAMGDDYVDWTTQNRHVKRMRLCGGTPEVIATDQPFVENIEVDEHAVYWLRSAANSTIDGTVMCMWKTGAPGYPEAGTDASPVDGSVGGGTVDGASDAADESE